MMYWVCGCVVKCVNCKKMFRVNLGWNLGRGQGTTRDTYRCSYFGVPMPMTYSEAERECAGFQGSLEKLELGKE